MILTVDSACYEQGGENEYKLATIEPVFINGLPSIVTFKSTRLEALTLPEPRYLAWHASCARVLHLSGAGEYIEQVRREEQELPVLASDCTGVGVLSFAITRHTGIGVC